MTEKTDLYILWTNDNILTAEKMVFMYAINSLKKDWWKHVTLIVWGATTRLVAENSDIQGLIKQARETGVHVSACKRCADLLGVTETLEELGIEVIYWGEPLTHLLKQNETLLTI